MMGTLLNLAVRIFPGTYIRNRKFRRFRCKDISVPLGINAAVTCTKLMFLVQNFLVGILSAEFQFVKRKWFRSIKLRL